jgi:glutaredoxin
MARQARIYTTPTCPYCRTAKKSLDDNGIKYRESSMVEDKSPREGMKNNCRSLAVRTICFDHEVVVGFNEAELGRKLGLQAIRAWNI